MLDHHTTIKHVGDIFGSVLTVATVLSQFAELLTPILTAVAAACAIAWWAVRFYDRWKYGPVRREGLD